MKKLSWSVLGALCILLAGCELDIPTDQVGKLETSEFCILSGGSFDYDAKRCSCGGELCGENVTCSYDNKANKTICAGLAYTLVPSGPCMMDKVIVCANRLSSNGNAIGYWTQCVNNEWTPVDKCKDDNSCMIYAFTETVMSSKCGSCQDNGVSCIAGESVSNAK